jgi:hypothetical protein
MEPAEVREGSCFVEGETEGIALSHRTAVENVRVGCHRMWKPGIVNPGNGRAYWNICHLQSIREGSGAGSRVAVDGSSVAAGGSRVSVGETGLAVDGSSDAEVDGLDVAQAVRTSAIARDRYTGVFFIDSPVRQEFPY